MPTLMTLQGADLGLHVIRDPNVDCASVHQAWQCSPGLAAGGLAGDNGFVSWLRQQNPIVAGALVIGLSIGTGLVVSMGAVALLEKAGYKADRSLHGSRRRRRRR